MSIAAVQIDRPVSRYAVIGAVLAVIGILPLAIAFSIGGLLQTSDGSYRGRGYAVFGLIFSLAILSVLGFWYFALRS